MKAEDTSGGALRGRNIIVAEDEAAVRDVLRRLLEINGCVVHAAENGRKALDLARTVQADLVVTDLWMPVMNGVELLEALRGSDSPTPVVVLSAHVTSATADKLEELGIFRILRKPVGVEAFLEAVRDGIDLAARRTGGTAPPAPSEAALAGGQAAGAAALPSARPGDEGALVVVADDDDGVRGFLRALLARAGYRVEEARDGEEAVEKAMADHVGLVLMDLNMPRVSGVKAIETLRMASSDCFIMCMTGECSEREINLALRAGAVSCLRKPFDAKDVLAEVGRLNLISIHRKRLAERERGRSARTTLPDRAREFARSVRHRYGRRLKWVAAAVVATVVLAAIAVPLIAFLMSRAARLGAEVSGKVGGALDSATRIEGYLQRDEAREVNH